MPFIHVINSRVNNLKNVSVKIPKNKLTVITGLSGSGKSSLAFDTIYAEGQRRYAESLNAYARQFMNVQDKPDVDEIQGLSPTIAIDQKNISQNPRSTVGTITEIYDYLRLLFSRLGTQYCPDCHLPVRSCTVGEIIELVRAKARHGEALLILAPLLQKKTVKPKELLRQLEKTGYEQFRLNGLPMALKHIAAYAFQPDKTYDIDIVVGKITDLRKQNLASPIEQALDLANGRVIVMSEKSGEEQIYTQFPLCSSCGRTFQAIEPRTFSFNSPYGACPRCTGLGRTLEVDPELVIPNPKLTLAEGAIQPWIRIVGNQNYYQKLLKAVADRHRFSIDTPIKNLPPAVLTILFYGTDGEQYLVDGKLCLFAGIILNLTTRHTATTSEYIRQEIEQYMKEKICPVCKGKRLKIESLAVKIGEYSIADIVELSVEEAKDLLPGLATINAKQRAIAAPIIKEAVKRLDNLRQVGLYYLNLNRDITTLAGGEAQRVRLSTQLVTGLTGVIYILDEPTIGLHPKDNDKLIATLKNLRDQGNTVIVVEHDKAMIEAADQVIDVGPGAGEYGGEIVFSGPLVDLLPLSSSLTALYLSGQEKIAVPKKYRRGNGKSLAIVGANAFNLKNIDVAIPLARFVCVTGVSGSGKSTLITYILSRALEKHFYRAKAEPGEYKKIKGLANIDKVISIDQTPIGRTPRSNPATYTGLFTAIRDLFTAVPEAKMRNYHAGMFSFNVKGGGRCEACAGEGYIRIPMQFLAAVFVECNECGGRRYNKETLEIHYQNKTIADVLAMTVAEAYRFFVNVSGIADKLQLLREVGLGYIHLGQPATTVSGGEAQRIKLATELSRRATGKTLYILDEPTTGLHFDDIKRLLHVLQQLVDKQNTVLIIEHNLEVIKCADWVIDLGPEGGKRGGEIVAVGTPPDIMKVKQSYTGQYLQKLLKPKS